MPWWLAGGQDAVPVGAVLTTMLPSGPMLVAEGPTDTAALLDMGFATVGRSCCTGGTQLLVELARIRACNDVVIVSDADENGRRGAKALASVLAAYLRRVRVICPPAGVKDARAWKQAGATAAEVQATIDAAPSWGVHHD
jgi:5S rRNA maturation endonuclease (ribonuclease M5)